MRYEHTPRPNTEYHHHIQELIETQDRRVADREMHREHEAVLADRGKELSTVALKDTLPFWCRSCKIDFHAETIREDERDWEDTQTIVSFYRTKCPVGHRCIRLALDKNRDPYYEQSRKVAQDRGAHRLDILQPFESGYEMLYSHKKRNA